MEAASSTTQPCTTCSTCRHWRRIDTAKAGRVATLALGECRLNPPQGVRQWPRTQDTDGCAQHKAAPAAKAKAIQPELLSTAPAT